MLDDGQWEARRSDGRQGIAEERWLLGAMLLSGEAITTATEVMPMQASNFRDPRHAAIFQAIVIAADERSPAAKKRSRPVDLLVLTNVLSDRGWLDDVGGAAELVALQADCPATYKVGQYAAAVVGQAPDISHLQPIDWPTFWSQP